ncbi:hypothetical protein POM88_012936 [Heracleum sosnowskyi]|uniref:Uncharacterized protein n=1 Tax=Heracleum sosnowskyi TaxID=360622 RepID=A0AAD8J185_9APIA|nr:hypothetical protein POM88_012936 [Heracleum sosnowskyi]
MIFVFALDLHLAERVELYLPSCFYRTKLRQQFFLHETLSADCLVHCCCELCALCQEYRWHGNAEKHNRETEMKPVAPVLQTRQVIPACFDKRKVSRIFTGFTWTLIKILACLEQEIP